MNSGKLQDWGFPSSRARSTARAVPRAEVGDGTEEGKQTDGARLAFPTQHSVISASFYKGAWKRGGWRGQKMLGTSRFAPGQLLIIALHRRSRPSAAEGWCWAAKVTASALALQSRGCVHPLTFSGGGRSGVAPSRGEQRCRCGQAVFGLCPLCGCREYPAGSAPRCAISRRKSEFMQLLIKTFATR